jgi:hypothetical protein
MHKKTGFCMFTETGFFVQSAPPTWRAVNSSITLWRDGHVELSSERSPLRLPWQP